MEKKGDSISTVEANLPPGFRFHPRDDELVCDYLMKKIVHGWDQSVVLIEVDLNKCEPWDIPQTARVGGKDWYFYSQRDRKYATGLRTNRATGTGYWKATGKDRAVLRKDSVVGMRKTLVFYQGRAPKGRKTDWVMHEFRLQGPRPSSSFMEDWVLCRVFHKNKEDQGTRQSTCSDDTASSSLPPLMDSYIAFDQTDSVQEPCFLHDNVTQQVPCFSISSQNEVTNAALANLTGSLAVPNAASTKYPNPLLSGQAPDSGLDHSLCSDQMVLRALLSQLTKVDASIDVKDTNIDVKDSLSFGERSSGSYLSEAVMPCTAWNYR